MGVTLRLLSGATEWEPPFMDTSNNGTEIILWEKNSNI